MRRLPIRLRLTLAFTAVMAIVLAGAGLLVHSRLDASLTGGLDSNLERSAAAFLGGPGGPAPLGPLGPAPIRGKVDPGTAIQLIDPRGQVVTGSAVLGSRPLLSGDQLRSAAQGIVRTEVDPGGGLGRLRLLAQPVPSQIGPLVAVIATSTRERDAALAGLTRELAIGGLLALALSGLGGYGLASLALRPVERMRRRAAAISGARQGERLPVPVARDEVSRLGETLNGMLDRLEATMARERAFVADASHELRTPLAILRGELELATARERPATEVRAAAASAAEEADRLGQLAEDLLTIARSDQGRLSLRPERVPASLALERVARRFARRAAGAGREVLVDPGPDPTLLADELRLEQALGNLVENALRHGAGPVTLAAERQADRVRVGVRDHGAGFPPEFLPRAFERFSRADDARGAGGSGLGLAIVCAIAEAHGGEAGAANASDGGAEVWLELPAAPAVLEPAPPPAAALPA
jgi:signal transduction histidine kinase